MLINKHPEAPSRLRRCVLQASCHARRLVPYEDGGIVVRGFSAFVADDRRLCVWEDLEPPKSSTLSSVKDFFPGGPKCNIFLFLCPSQLQDGPISTLYLF